MRRIVVIADLSWSVHRVHKDLEKALGDEYSFVYYDCGRFDGYMFLEDARNGDVILTTLHLYGDILHFLKDDDQRRKVAFICHGYPEYFAIDAGTLPTLNYGVTSTVMIPYLNCRISNPIYLTPNGIDPDNFTHRERNGIIKSVGWCGSPGIPTKRLDMAIEITQQSNLPLNIAMTVPFEKISEWYQTIDLFIVTAGTNRDSESGPLPPFEAIASGVPAIGTMVGNFSLVPGPKFTTIEEAVDIIEYLKSNPEETTRLAREQYEWVMNNWSYDVLKHHWIKMFDDIIERTQDVEDLDNLAE